MSAPRTGPTTRGRARAAGRGRIRAGDIDADVTFAHADEADQAAIDEAYDAKYDHYGPRIDGSVTDAAAHTATIRLIPEKNPI